MLTVGDGLEIHVTLYAMTYGEAALSTTDKDSGHDQINFLQGGWPLWWRGVVDSGYQSLWVSIRLASNLERIPRCTLIAVSLCTCTMKYGRDAYLQVSYFMHYTCLNSNAKSYRYRLTVDRLSIGVHLVTAIIRNFHTRQHSCLVLSLFPEKLYDM